MKRSFDGETLGSVRTVNNSYGGFVKFHEMVSNPSILNRILEKLSLEEIGNLGQVCKPVQSHIVQWIFSQESRSKLFYSLFGPSNDDARQLCFSIESRVCGPVLDPNSEEEWRRNFQRIGILLKKLTCLKSIFTRLRLVTKLMEQIKVHSTVCVHDSTRDPLWDTETLLYSCNALFAYSYMSGWDSLERSLAFGHAFALVQHVHNSIGLKVDRLWKSDYIFGSNAVLECTVRKHIFYLYWLEVHPKSDRGFWLNEVLKKMAGSHDEDRQAVLLFMVFGPLKTVSWAGQTLSWIMWDDMQNPLHGSHQQTVAHFQPIADALTSLYDYKAEHMTPRLMTALFCNSHDYVEGWDEQNVAAVLLLMSPESREWFLTHKLTDDDAAEVPSFLTQMLVLAATFDMDMTPIVRLITRLFTGENVTKSAKLALIEALWCDLTDHLQDTSMVDAQTAEINRIPVMTAIAELGRSLMARAYQTDPAKESDSQNTIEIEE